MDRLMTGVSLLTSGGMNVVWAGLIASIWWLQRRPQDAALLFFGTALGTSFITPLKLLFARSRPIGSPVVDSFAFPSGHALSITMLMGLLAWLLDRRNPQRRLWYVSAAVMIAALVGYSRIYLLAHYVTDVFAGYGFGLIFVFLWIRLTRRLQRT